MFEKTKRFEVKRSSIISTQVSKSGNWITWTYRAVKNYRQSISWGDETGINVCQEYNSETLEVFCECKFFCKQWRYSGKCCKHIVGQMRRVIYIMNHDLEIHEQWFYIISLNLELKLLMVFLKHFYREKHTLFKRHSFFCMT